MKSKKKADSKNARKWASFKKLWIVYKIAKGRKDMDTQVKTAKKLVKIAHGLKDGKGKHISIPSFEELRVLQFAK